MPRGAWLLARIIWAGEDENIPELRRLALIEAAGLPEVKSRKRSPGTLQGIIDAVIEDMRHPPKCTRCVGRGRRMSQGLLQDCDRCDGSGLRYLSGREYARRLGIHYRRYYRRERAIHAAIAQMLDEWHQAAWRYLAGSY